MKEININYTSEIPENFTGKVIWGSGDVFYYKNGLYHREDGLPAVEYNNGDKEYHVEGKLHRIGGPAVIYTDGYEKYWINGQCVTKKAHDLLVNLLKLKK